MTIPDKQSGIVLVTILLLITMLSLLVLTQMQGVFLDYKAINQLAEMHQVLFQLEKSAKKWVTTPPRECVIQARDVNAVVRLLQNRQGCISTQEKQQFYYLVEDLGLFPCVQTVVEKVSFSTHHWRISILSVNQHAAVLQWRVAKRAPAAACEHNEPIFIQAGLVSWRHLKAQKN
ncbi:hypothetical protein [Legionella maceachernii]|uniref:Tfp pilus assembly protein PilX n=1 Tax=Legionella maceachernii TaxID=466 RepID=A0A0W0W589_9GAMM|nr:hypothetical protein [Legionella maceachernii]KTD27465.1 hypothetical protein Lmac_1205 [Legionella maceachernii]SKA22309.1 hypothetical protein SAMN02745128_02647 [Legionella maceachernii]SUP01432.1 Uncharacterised protein [Legionella maceachernii]